MPATAVNAENDELACLIETYRDRGDRRVAERLFSMQDKILNHLVRRYADRCGESYEDLRQVGCVGLMKAINGYRAESGARFSSYAYAMIEGELRHHFRDTALVKKPRWARSLYARMSEATERLTAELGRPPFVEEVAEEVNVTPQGVTELMKLFLDTNVASLDGDESQIDLSEIKSLHYETLSLPVEDRILLEQALESLSELQKKVVYLFFYKDLSQTDIGRRLHLPQRKISRIIASAVKSLRDSHDAANGNRSGAPETI